MSRVKEGARVVELEGAVNSNWGFAALVLGGSQSSNVNHKVLVVCRTWRAPCSPLCRGSAPACFGACWMVLVGHSAELIRVI
jgi:hypothetical protein